jgi:predicted nucleotidyltransferase
MIHEWNNYTGFKVLSFFINNSNLKIHINELARKLKISTSSVFKYCNLYLKNNFLFKEKKANSVFYFLNNDNVFIISLKKSLFIGTLIKSKPFLNFIDNNKKNIVSFILYGSYASGNYTEKSDIDLLIIYNKNNIDYSEILKLESIFNKQLGLTKISLNQWIEKLNNKDIFINSVLKNNVCLWGENLNDF